MTRKTSVVVSIPQLGSGIFVLTEKTMGCMEERLGQ